MTISNNELHPFSLIPFSRMTYTSKNAKDYWEPVYRSIEPSLLEMEYQSMLGGVFNAVALPVSRFAKEKRDFSADGVRSILLSSAIPAKTQGWRFFAAKEGPVDYMLLTKSDTVSACFVPNDQDLTLRCGIVSAPPCCQDAMAERLEQGFSDHALAAARMTPGHQDLDDVIVVEGHPLLNPVMRLWGIRVLPYQPCNFQCKTAIDQAEMVLDIAEVLRPGAKTAIERIMEMPSLWDGWRGVARLSTPVFIGVSSSDSYVRRRKLRYIPSPNKHYKHQVVPMMAHGTEFPFLTVKRHHQILIEERSLLP